MLSGPATFTFILTTYRADLWDRVYFYEKPFITKTWIALAFPARKCFVLLQFNLVNNLRLQFTQLGNEERKRIVLPNSAEVVRPPCATKLIVTRMDTSSISIEAFR